MTESVDFHDKHLDPPDEPEYDTCDNCGITVHAGDLNKWHGFWLCDECFDQEEE